METLWFILVGFMMTVYVILDGFDLGAGIVHLLVARNEEERRTVLGAIGPFWDGNEVWIIAAGGTLYCAFPLLYASSFSGFYLPLIMMLWLLMIRGLSIEFRHQVEHPMWRSFWDSAFFIASALLAVFLGAALGNVVRGVPLGPDGYFFEPLWTSFAVVERPGVLDWFTVTMGLVAFFTLASHGASFLALRTKGMIQRRARSLARKAWLGTVATSGIALLAASSIRPSIWSNYGSHPAGLVFPAAGCLGLLMMRYFMYRARDLGAFLASSAFIGGMLASTAYGLYPFLLPSSADPSLGLTIYNTATDHYGLGVALAWWILGMILAAGYFVFLYRTFRGKVSAASDGHGY